MAWPFVHCQALPVRPNPVIIESRCPVLQLLSKELLDVGTIFYLE